MIVSLFVLNVVVIELSRKRGEAMKKTTEYQISGIQIYTQECAGHHIARATLEAGRRVEDHDNHVVAYYSEDIVGEGITKRSSSDRRDGYVGQNLAMGRALEVLAEKVLKRAVGKVKHNDDMKLQRAHKKEYDDYVKSMEQPVEIRVIPAQENMSTVGRAISKGLHLEDGTDERGREFKDRVVDLEDGHADAMFGDDLFDAEIDKIEDTHFEESYEEAVEATERLIDEC